MHAAAALSLYQQFQSGERVFNPYVLASIALFSSTASAQQLPPVPEPVENPITEEKRLLGKILFWDEQLSSDNTVSCGTCHIPANAGSDPRLGEHPGVDGLFGTEDDVIGSPGVVRSDANNGYAPDVLFGLAPQVTGRAAPSVVGSQWALEMFWDGRAESTFLNPETGAVSIASGGALENQTVGPLLSSAEMAHDARDWPSINSKLQVVEPLRLASNIPSDVAAVLGGGVSYPDLFQSAFGDPQITSERIAFAVATYERTLVPDQTPWDLFMAGDTSALTQQQAQGWNLLENNTVCLNCHVPPLFTDNKFWNIGLRPADEDLGRSEVTGAADDRGRFKTPTLRNVGLKNALMHTGRITDVQDAIDFYNAPPWPMVDPMTGHTQYTQEQTGIPTANPNVFADYNNLFMPVQTMGGTPFQAAVIDFIENGLTDPRVANEQYPFDRPTLHSEVLPVNPSLYGVGAPGTGGFEPEMVALSPLVGSNPDFKVGIGGGLGGATAFLVLARAPAAPVGGGLPLYLSRDHILGRFVVQLSGSGPGQGYATFQRSMATLSSASIGALIYAQWFIGDPQAVGGLAATKAVEWTIQ